MQKINVRNLLRIQKTGQTIRPLHIILGNRNLEKFGEIVNIPADSITYHPQFNAVDELSFNVYNEQNGEIERLWDKIIDFKTVYVKEYNEWFEITASIDESEINTKKVITAKSLCEAELGQVILHDVEINTEDDITREEYTEPTIFYNPSKKNCSLLNRILEKVPGYTIAHVDETLLNIQRSFSIDGTSVYDFLTTTLSQEIGCIFLFDSNTRSIYVYDMETCCLSCDYRSEDSFTVCPECGGTIIHEPYGKDTSIFIDKNNLGSDIQLTSETDSIKNCFRVIGGDDLINATLKNINPNGSNYIYYFNNDTLLDMPNELQSKIKSYDELVNEYSNSKSFSLEASLVNQYNDIIEYIKKYYPDTTYSSIQQQYIGWSNITSVYYNIIDLYSYLNSSMMPTWKQQDKTAASQLALLTPSNLSPVAVTDVSKISVYTANNAVLAMAKAIIDTSIYKVEILDGSTLKSQTWTGRFKLTSYSDKEDTAEMKTAISIAINDDYIAYVNQQVDKAMGKVNDQGLQEIYKIESLDTFKIELHKYSAQRLTSYQSAYQTAINVLTEQGVASESSNLHDSIYLPYYERFIALESELSYRNSQIDTLTGLEKYIEDLISKTHNDLDFESYIGEKYWKLFTYYRREDDYSNDNYISDGLTNTELIDKANELLVVAKKELVKSGEKQFTISGTLQNLLLLTDKDGNRIFEPILDDFTLGNFIRTKIDGKIYVMRLADISISYGDLSKLSVTFSDAYRYGSPDINIVKDILTKSQSMASSYSSTVKQASQGEKANLTFERLQKEGLDSALYNVHNTNSTAIFDEHGILIRSYDDVLDDYKDEQARINVNELVYTTDRWRTAVTALGKQKYTLDGVEYEKYGLNTDFVISGVIIAGDIYSANYTTDSKGVCTAGTHFNLATGDCNIGGDTFSYNAVKKKLQIKNVDIEWSTTTSPDISDVNGLSDKINSINNSIADNSKKITSVSQTAGKINWLVASGNSQASMTLTDKLYELMAENINLKGKVTFECFDSSAQSKITNAQKTADDIASNIYISNSTTINGGKIATNSITANAINIDDLNAFKATIGGWNINDEAIYHDQGNYRVYLQKATSPDTWTFSCQEKRDGVYYGNFYIKQNGEMYASNAKITGEINATKLTASGYGWSGGSTYKMVASLIGGEMKISNETDGSYFSIQGHGVFARNNRNFNTLTLISNAKDGSADGMTITGESGTEVQVLRDGIKMWHMPNRTKMTWIGKGEISIDTGGTRSFCDAALSVFGDIKATGIYCMHGTEQRKMAVVLNRLEASNSDISMSWDGQFLRFWVDDTVINTWDNDNKTWC